MKLEGEKLDKEIESIFDLENEVYDYLFLENNVF